MNALSADTFIKSHIVSLLWQETNYKLAGFILRNRFEAGWHTDNWLALVFTYNKYAGNPVANNKSLPNMNDGDFRNLMTFVDDLYSGEAEDKMSQGALYYADLGKPTTEFFKTKILTDPTSHRFCGTVGTVSLFT